MNNTSGMVTFQQPQDYYLVSTFADTTRRSFEEIRTMRPANAISVKKALDDFLSNCLFPNCSPNNGYINALGLGKKSN